VIRRSLLLCAALALVPSSDAFAAERWASPAGAGTDCTAAAPCALDTAVDGAAANDDVVVTPGTYPVTTPVDPAEPITLRGVAGQPRPRLVGAASLTRSTVSATGSILRHLRIEASAPGQDTLTLKGGTAEDLVLAGGQDDAAKITAVGPTVLRDSVAFTPDGDAGVAALKVREAAGGGSVDVRNVTAWAPNGSADGIRCETSNGSTATLRNAIAHGAQRDIDAGGSGVDCDIAYSSFRFDRSVVSGPSAGNQDGGALLADTVACDFRPLLGSPTIDAGIDEPLLGGLTDLRGVLRTTPDIGAFEYDAAAPADSGAVGCATAVDWSAVRATPTPATPASPVATEAQAHPAHPLGGPPGQLRKLGVEELPLGVTPPALGRTVAVAPGSGTVRVRVAGATTYRALKAGDAIPVGSVVDARTGAVRLSTATPEGFQTGTFKGSRFEVRQNRTGTGMTELVLRGGDFARCGRRARAATAVAAATRRKRRRVRALWGQDRGGRFRTRGANSVATVRGTRWLTEDRCDGTLTRVTQGTVDVRDVRRRVTRRVRAGHALLVRAPRS
jgi:hypothetical protein